MRILHSTVLQTEYRSVSDPIDFLMQNHNLCINEMLLDNCNILAIKFNGGGGITKRNIY